MNSINEKKCKTCTQNLLRIFDVFAGSVLIPIRHYKRNWKPYIETLNYFNIWIILRRKTNTHSGEITVVKDVAQSRLEPVVYFVKV